MSDPLESICGHKPKRHSSKREACWKGKCDCKKYKPKDAK